MVTPGEESKHLDDTREDKCAGMQTGSGQLSDALTRWSQVLGSEYVLSDDRTLEHYSRSTLPTSTLPAAVLRPRSRDEVRQVVGIASEHRVPLYPISCGKNWGYGDACAVTNGQVIVDLSRMNRILEVDPVLAYAVIEPGVTQQQLYEYLKENRLPLWLDGTGAGPDASIVGNVLERGFGHTPYGNRILHTCGMEVVLADGSVLNTGFGAYANAKAARVFPQGIGPWMDGLFTQSNLGIVTSMGVWLMPAPDVCQGFALKVRCDDQLEAIVEALRPLRLSGVVQSVVHIANDLRVISARRQYPWDLTGGDTPLPDNVRRRLHKEAGLGAWNMMGGLYGTRAGVAAARKAVRRAFRGVAHVHFFGQWELNLGHRVARLLRRIGLAKNLLETVESAQSVYQLLKGQPSVEHLKGVFWRSRRRPDAERPDPTEAGLLWISPVLPMTGAASRELVNLVGPIFTKYGFEPLITLTSVTSRALVGVISICYDKADAAECQRATECYDNLFELLTTHGYIPYRVGIGSMEKLAKGAPMLWGIAETIKRGLDPQAILAPGRYQPSLAATH